MASRLNVSLPLMPSEAADSPLKNSRGTIPIWTRLDRWMRSKLSAMTARTPKSRGPFAAQSRLDPDPYIFPAMMTQAISSLA